METIHATLTAVLPMLASVVPEQWQELWLSIESSETMLNLGSFYRTHDGNICALQPPMEVMILCDEALRLSSLEALDAPVWTTLTAHVDNTGQFSADIGYELLVPEQQQARRQAWKERYLIASK
jgi:hypothetical protein